MSSSILLQNDRSSILQRLRKNSPRSILVASFIMLVVGVLGLVSGSMVLSKIMVYVVLCSMFCCAVLGILNRVAEPKERDDGK